LKGLRNWIAIAVFLVVFLSVSSASAVDSVELAYDNNNMSTTRNGSATYGFAVSFSPPIADWPIQRVRIYGYRWGTGTETLEFVIEVWAANYTTLFSAAYPHNIFKTAPSWIDIDIAGPKVSGTFFVVLITASRDPKGIAIGVDTSLPNRHSELVVGKRLVVNWNQTLGVPLRKETANWMIRVVGGGGTLKPASTQTTTTSLSTATTSTPLFGFLDMSTLQQIGGVTATAGAGFLGWFLKTRKRRFVSGYLAKVDSLHSKYSLNREECKKQLSQMKDEIVQLLRKGKIDEAQFTILDNKITQYLQDLG
jgi:hypothetical protein